MSRVHDQEPTRSRRRLTIPSLQSARPPGKPEQSEAPERSDANYRIAPLTPRYVSGVVDVFARSFPDTLLTALGPGFLGELLGSYARLPGGCGYVGLNGQEVVGFVVGSEDSAQHRRTLLRQRWAPMVLQGLRTLTTSPHLAGRLARYLGHQFLSSPATGRRRQKPAGFVPKASLTLVAVAPPHRRRGVGDQLTRAFLGEMSRRRVDRVKLAVSASNQAALALYTEQGWQPAGAYVTSEGRLA